MGRTVQFLNDKVHLAAAIVSYEFQMGQTHLLIYLKKKVYCSQQMNNLFLISIKSKKRIYELDGSLMMSIQNKFKKWWYRWTIDFNKYGYG